MEEATLQRSSDPSLLAWHPEHKMLAVAWSSGELTVWNEHEHELSETSNVHRGKVKCLQWASGGKRLVSGDQVRLALVTELDNGPFKNKQTLKQNVTARIISIERFHTHFSRGFSEGM